MRIRVAVCSVVVFGSAQVALAERTDDGEWREQVDRGGYTQMRPLEPGMFNEVVPADHGGSHILFLNPCWDRCTVQPGFEDSRQNRSSLLQSTVTIDPYPHSEANWDEMVACVQRLYAPFNVTVTDVDPGSTPHFETITAGHPSNVGAPGALLGFAPGGCSQLDASDGAIVENGLSFTFARGISDIYGSDDPRLICEVVAQEAAHSMGVPDHLLEACDPMTYLQGCETRKSFQDKLSSCGETNPKQCYCGGTQRNAYAELLENFGAPLPTPPEVTITAPGDGASVAAGFIVRANVTDPQGVDRVELYIDNQLRDTGNVPPYIFNAPNDLSEGGHVVRVTGYDSFGTAGSDEIDVVIGEPCGGDDDCAGDEACVDGRCVLGPGSPGGLGEPCESGANCASGTCGDVGGERLCTEACNPGADGCPGGFRCLSAGGGQGACWPGGDGGGGCCTIAGGGGGGHEDTDPGGPLALGALVALWLAWSVRRRRA